MYVSRSVVKINECARVCNAGAGTGETDNMKCVKGHDAKKIECVKGSDATLFECVKGMPRYTPSRMTTLVWTQVAGHVA